MPALYNVRPSFAPSFGASSIVESRATNDSTTQFHGKVVCAWAVSGQYGPGTRFLFYILVAGCVFARKKPWLRSVCLAAALVVSAVAAIHGIVLAAVHQPGALDLDLYGALQLTSIGILAAPVTVRISNTYFKDPGRNIIFLWTGILLAGLMSMTVEFFRVQPVGCILDYDPVTLKFPYEDGDRCGLICNTESHGPQSPIRRGTTNDIQVVPVPARISISMAILISAGCCVPAVLMLISTWLKIREKNRKKQEEAEKALDKIIEGTNHATMRRMNSINSNIRELLRVVELAVFSGAIIGLLVMGELNFFSDQLNQNAEPMTSVGQWGPIVGTLLGAIGSLYVVLAKDVSRWLKGVDDSTSVSDDGCTCTCSRHGSHDPPHGRYGWTQQAPRLVDGVDDGVTDNSSPDVQRPSQDADPYTTTTRSDEDDIYNSSGLVMPQPPQPTHPGSLSKGSRGKAYRFFTSVNRFLGTAQEPHGQYKVKEASQYPTTPGEEFKNAALPRTRNTWKRQVEHSLSNSCNASVTSTSPIDEDPGSPLTSSPRQSQSSISMSPAKASTPPEMYRLTPSSSMPVGEHLQVPEQSFGRRTRRSTSPSVSRPGIPVVGDIPGGRSTLRPAIAITRPDTSSSSSLVSPTVDALPLTA